MTVIQELLLEMERNVFLLEGLRKVPKDEFVADPYRYLLAERCFQLAIQCLIDASSYLASTNRWARAEDSREAILVLGRQGGLPLDFATRIAGMANFRNVLVHAYLRINREIVFEYLDKLYPPHPPVPCRLVPLKRKFHQDCPSPSSPGLNNVGRMAQRPARRNGEGYSAPTASIYSLCATIWSM